MQAIITSEFASLVGQDSGVVLVDFWAVWCGPCMVLKPQLEQMSHQYAGKVSFYGVDVDKESDLSMQFGIRSIPTVMVFVN
jgi:thioredoxin 1